ncbi:Hypothetical protein FKW44_010098, partial [Caligus rogercresseyi]
FDSYTPINIRIKAVLGITPLDLYIQHMQQSQDGEQSFFSGIPGMVWQSVKA